MKPLEIRFRPAGEFAYGLAHRKNARELARPFWEASESVGVVRQVPSRVDVGSSGKKAMAATAKALSVLPMHRDKCAAYWAAEWPGTRTWDSFVLLVGRLADADFEAFFPSGTSLMWRGFGGWEDLFLFSGTDLKYYCCTHEDLGSVFGSREALSPFGTAIRPVGEVDFSLVARGDPIEKRTWDRLARGLTRS